MNNTSTKSGLSDLMSVFVIFRKNILETIKKEGYGHDLTFSQAEVLNFIDTTGKETMKGIAEHLRITPPSATEIVTEMEKKGLVKRMNAKKDRRIVFITLTDVAKKFSVIVCKRKELVFKRMLKKLNKKDRESFERIIRVLITK